MEKITTVLFDLDGTLLPMDAENFEKLYLKSLAKHTGSLLEPDKMLKSVYIGQKAMVESTDATQTNADVFYDTFGSIVGPEIKSQMMDILDEYYLNDFVLAKEATSQSQEMIDAVKHLKNVNKRVILATNPILPRIATDRRIEWAGFELEDFEDITRFEKNHFCKPSIQYYQEIIKDNNLIPEQCLMIGNDVEEDLIASQLGMKTWLIEDDLIHRGTEINCDWRGSRKEFITKIKETFQ